MLDREGNGYSCDSYERPPPYNPEFLDRIARGDDDDLQEDEDDDDCANNNTVSPPSPNPTDPSFSFADPVESTAVAVEDGDDAGTLHTERTGTMSDTTNSPAADPSPPLFPSHLLSDDLFPDILENEAPPRSPPLVFPTHEESTTAPASPLTTTTTTSSPTASTSPPGSIHHPSNTTTATTETSPRLVTSSSLWTAASGAAVQSYKYAKRVSLHAIDTTKELNEKHRPLEKMETQWNNYKTAYQRRKRRASATTNRPTVATEGEAPYGPGRSLI